MDGQIVNTHDRMIACKRLSHQTPAIADEILPEKLERSMLCSPGS